MRLQNDVLSLPADRLIKLLQAIPQDRLAVYPKASCHLDIERWDRHEHANSAAAAIHQFWYSQSLPHLQR